MRLPVTCKALPSRLVRQRISCRRCSREAKEGKSTSYAVLSNPLTREAYDRNLRVSEARYSELNPAHSEKCGQLTLYWHTERKIAPCEACRSERSCVPVRITPNRRGLLVLSTGLRLLRLKSSPEVGHRFCWGGVSWRLTL